jgi:hypothetical protein
MNGFDSPSLQWFLLATQLLGVVSAFAARLSEGSPRQAISQRMFFGALCVMGTATIVALAVGPGCWLACSTSLAVMVLTVICDFRGGRQASTW